MNSKFKGTTEELESFQAKIKIDKYVLDDSLEDQVELFQEVADRSALANERRDGLKAQHEELRALTDQDIRGAAEVHGSKITEAAIANKISATPEVQAIYQEFLEAKALADRWSVLVRSISERGHMLRDLVQLYIAGYFQNTSQGATRSTQEALYQRQRGVGQEPIRTRTKRG